MKPPVVNPQLLIRKPAHEVFNALTDPEITTKFWFTKGSGKVVQGASLRWDWEMYGVHADVNVREVDINRRILIEWDNGVAVEWILEARDDETTLVCIRNSGFRGTDDEVVAKAIDSMGGFTSLLAAMKAYLEHGIELNLVADHHPDAHVKNE